MGQCWSDCLEKLSAQQRQRGHLQRMQSLHGITTVLDENDPEYYDLQAELMAPDEFFASDSETPGEGGERPLPPLFPVTSASLSVTQTPQKRYERAEYVKHINRLPLDLMLKVFGHLGTQDLCMCAQVCRRWRSIAYDPVLWREFTPPSRSQIDDSVLKGIARGFSAREEKPRFRQLQVFKIDGKRHSLDITDEGIYAMLASVPLLRQLTLRSCEAVTDAVLFRAVERCPLLERIVLSGCPRISDRGVAALFEGLRHLRELQLDNCARVTADSVRAAVNDSGSEFMRLTVCGTTGVDPVVTEQIVEAAGELTFEIVGGGSP